MKVKKKQMEEEKRRKEDLGAWTRKEGTDGRRTDMWYKYQIHSRSRTQMKE